MHSLRQCSSGVRPQPSGPRSGRSACGSAPPRIGGSAVGRPLLTSARGRRSASHIGCIGIRRSAFACPFPTAKRADHRPEGMIGSPGSRMVRADVFSGSAQRLRITVAAQRRNRTGFPCPSSQKDVQHRYRFSRQGDYGAFCARCLSGKDGICMSENPLQAWEPVIGRKARTSLRQIRYFPWVVSMPYSGMSVCHHEAGFF